MFGIIFTHEIRLMLRLPATWVMLGLLALAMAFGIVNGVRAVERQQLSASVAVADEAAAKARVRDQLIAYEKFTAARGIPKVFAPVNHAPPRPGESPQGTNAGAVGGELIKEVAILPATGLAPFAIGQMDLQRNYTLVDMKNKFNMSDNFEIENPLNLMVGTFDLAFVIIFLLPIFIIALTYDMLSGEKENGTLALTMTQPVSLAALMRAKLAARVGVLMLVILLLGFGAMLYSGLRLDTLGDAGTWGRFAVFLLATFLYAMFWFGLGVLVSAFNKSSETNVTILAGAWLLMVVIVPALTSLVATSLFPAPSRMELKVAMRDNTIASEKSEDDTTKAYYSDHVEMAQPNDVETYLTVFLAKQEALEKAIAPAFATFRAQQEKQVRLVNWLQFLSPAVVLQSVLNEAAGTSVARYNDYMDKVFAFHGEWRAYFAPRYLRQEILDSAQYDAFPRFRYGVDKADTVSGGALLSLAGLLILVVGVNLFAFVRLRGYSVRGGG